MWCVHAEQRLCVFCSASVNFVCELSNHVKGYERHASRGGEFIRHKTVSNSQFSSFASRFALGLSFIF